MLKRREDLSNIIVAIDDLAKHPPETPMERLRAALLIAEANEILADAADGEERLRRRTTLPDGYHLLHRKPKRAADPDAQLWSVLRGETEICTHRYREKACEMAWTHHDEPELFEGFDGVSEVHDGRDMTPEAIREEYDCIAQDVDGASIQMQRVVNDDSPIDREDIDGDLKGLREQVRRLEALRERVPEPESTPAS